MKIYLKQSAVAKMGVAILPKTLTVKKVNKKKIRTVETKTRKRRPKLSRRSSQKNLNLVKNASNKTLVLMGKSLPKMRSWRKKFTINVVKSKNGRRLSN